MNIKDLNKNDKIVLALNSNNRDLLKVLAKETDEDINFNLAKNSNTPIEVLKNLNFNHIYKDNLNENYSFKKYIDLMNDENFSKMATIKQEAIIKMFKMIDNKEDISIEQCNIFMKIENNHLLNKIASYEKTPDEILKKLYDLKPDIVGYNLAINPNCPQYILDKLAKTTLSEQAKLVRKDENILTYIACNPNTHRQTLVELAKTDDLNILTHIASNPNTPNYTLDELAKTKDKDILTYIASNPNTPIYTLEELAKTKDLNILTHIASNPNTLRNTLEELAKNEDITIRNLAINHKNNSSVFFEKYDFKSDFER